LFKEFEGKYTMCNALRSFGKDAVFPDRRLPRFQINQLPPFSAN
jgi:hypothetical protein